MQRISARDAKNGFGHLIDLSRAKPVAVEKYGRPVVVVMAIEEYDRLVKASGKEAALGEGNNLNHKRQACSAGRF